MNHTENKFRMGDAVKTAFGTKGVIVKKSAWGWWVDFEKRDRLIEVVEQDIELTGEQK